MHRVGAFAGREISTVKLGFGIEAVYTQYIYQTSSTGETVQPDFKQTLWC